MRRVFQILGTEVYGALHEGEAQHYGGFVNAVVVAKNRRAAKQRLLAELNNLGWGVYRLGAAGQAKSPSQARKFHPQLREALNEIEGRAVAIGPIHSFPLDESDDAVLAWYSGDRRGWASPRRFSPP